jgi:hypothetical protein
LHGTGAPGEAAVGGQCYGVQLPCRCLDKVDEDEGEVHAEVGQLLGKGLARASCEPDAKDALLTLPSEGVEEVARFLHARRIRGGIDPPGGHGCARAVESHEGAEGGGRLELRDQAAAGFVGREDGVPGEEGGRGGAEGPRPAWREDR